MLIAIEQLFYLLLMVGILGFESKIPKKTFIRKVACTLLKISL